MSELDEAMIEHMAYIVLSEHRPFYFRDFLRFEVDEKEYHMTAKTFRNKILGLRRSGEVELVCNSGTAFYTLKGYRFGKPMTPIHVGVRSFSNDPMVRIIENLPMDRNAVHDIRLRFEVKDIWTYLSTYHSELLIKQYSKDIQIPTWNIEDLHVRITVHKTDTVSVSIGCSLTPVAADVNGLIRLSNALTRVEEKLGELFKNNSDIPSGVIVASPITRLQVPSHRGWLVTMWHFGTDALVEYTGDKFSATWEVGQRALVRAYTKTMKDNKTRIRLERQECPNKTFPEAIEEKLNAGACRSEW